MNRFFIVCIMASVYGCSSAQKGSTSQDYKLIDDPWRTNKQKLSEIKKQQALIEMPKSISSIKVIHQVSPQYPEDAANKCIEGKVDLEFIVQKEGSVSNVLIKKAEPNTLFNKVAIEAIRQWRFKPKLIDNQLVEQKAQQQFIFNKSVSCSSQPPVMQLNKDTNALFVNPDNNIYRSSAIDLLLVKGQEFLIEKKPKRAEYYFDKAIEQCKDQYYSEGKQIFAARSQTELLYYLMFYGLTGLAGDNEVIVIEPSCAEALYHKGFTQLELGQIDSAINYHKKAIAMSPLNSKFLSELGHIYHLQKDWKNALDIFTESENYAGIYSPPEVRQQELLRAKRGMGYSLIETGALEKAKTKYEECLEIDSNDKISLMELKYINNMLKKQANILN